MIFFAFLYIRLPSKHVCTDLIKFSKTRLFLLVNCRTFFLMTQNSALHILFTYTSINNYILISLLFIDDICGKVPNLCAHICENTFDAYKCSCRPGYNLDDNNVTCSQQNKKDGGICPDGYVMDKLQGKCVDIDECFNNLTNFCKTEMHQECKNTVGSYYCNCLSGYSLDVTQNECVGKYVIWLTIWKSC